MKGPKDISSFLFLTFKLNNIAEITAPLTNENKVINNTPLTPNIKPRTAINFISPPPIALVVIAIIENIPAPAARPIKLSETEAFSYIIRATPITIPTKFNPSGIILCFKSIKLIIMSKMIKMLCIADINDRPYLNSTTSLYGRVKRPPAFFMSNAEITDVILDTI